MPVCDKCFKMFPPDVMSDIVGTKGRECVFCKSGRTSLKDASGKQYTKDECIKDYQKMLKRLKDNTKIAEIIK